MGIWNKSWTILDNLMNIGSLGSMGAIHKGLTGQKDKGLTEWLGSLIGGEDQGVSDIIGAQVGNNLSGAQREQNEWNEQMAVNAYNRQVDFYNNYQSPEAQVRQYQEAGLNPALMYQNGGSTPSAISSSASSGSSPGTPDLIGKIAQLGTLSENIKNWQVDRKLKTAEVDQTDARTKLMLAQERYYTETLELQKNVLSKNLEEADARIVSLMANAALAQSGISVNEGQTALLGYQACIAKVNSEMQKEINDATIAAAQAAARLNNSQADKNSEEYRRLVDGYDAAMASLYASAQKIVSEANIANKEDTYWATEKGIQAYLIQSQIYDNSKGNVFGLTVTNNQIPDIYGRSGIAGINGQINPYTEYSPGQYVSPFSQIEQFTLPKWSFKPKN